MDYPQTPDGQSRYLHDLVTQSLETGAVSGIRPWAPDYCLASGGWTPMNLFTEDGIAKRALSAIQDSLLAADVGAEDLDGGQWPRASVFVKRSNAYAGPTRG